MIKVTLIYDGIEYYIEHFSSTEQVHQVPFEKEFFFRMPRKK